MRLTVIGALQLNTLSSRLTCPQCSRALWRVVGVRMCLIRHLHSHGAAPHSLCLHPNSYLLLGCYLTRVDYNLCATIHTSRLMRRRFSWPQLIELILRCDRINHIHVSNRLTSFTSHHYVRLSIYQFSVHLSLAGGRLQYANPLCSPWRCQLIFIRHHRRLCVLFSFCHALIQATGSIATAPQLFI
jgi:hypothetical protein